MEVVEPDHEPGTGVLAMSVRVNGVDVGRLAEAPKIDLGNGRDQQATITLVLVPSRVDVRGDDDRPDGITIGFAAGP
ncbi:hypothetical protein ACFY1A_16845 [Streptomyces sp. NPDC001520]|uniref:hypothetical protein n=1 Tax=Streptomyces sp. NPDC001520 TaxID=3364581 RepID=UPI00369ECD4B